jgi:hypothetical protein
MANLSWAIEQIVQGPTGEPVRQRGVPPPDLVAAAPVDPGEAQLVYRLMTPVADNWHPLVPVVVEPGAGGRRPLLALELRQMIRASAGGDAELRPGPLGELLRAPLGDDSARLRIAEESVLAEGVRVSRRYQAARTSDGRCLVWIGRDRRVAQRFPPSALRFDVSDPPST